MKVNDLIDALKKVDGELDITTIGRIFSKGIQIHGLKHDSNEIKGMTVCERKHIYSDCESRNTVELVFNIETDN